MSEEKKSFFRKEEVESKRVTYSDFALEKMRQSTKERWDDGDFDNQRFSQEQVIERFRQVHGEKYDYSKVAYVNQRTKVTIICRDCGEFSQLPNNHWNGQGCPSCGRKGLRVTTEEMIQRFRKVHGDKYDYSKFEYLGATTKSIIICSIHGEFKILPNNHSKGSGCPKCKLIDHLDFQLVVDLLCDGKSLESVASEVGFNSRVIARRIRTMKKDGTISQYLKGRVLPDGRKKKS